MVVCFEIEENLEKKSNSLFERGVFFTFDMSTGVISKYVNWIRPQILKNKINFKKNRTLKWLINWSLGKKLPSIPNTDKSF